MYMSIIFNIKRLSAVWNEACEFCTIMSYRMFSSLLLCCDSLNCVKLMFLLDFVLYNVFYGIVMSF